MIQPVDDAAEHAAGKTAADGSETRIYFEDAHCAVVYKKAGEDSQTFFKGLFPQKRFAAAVNRLDTPVSGLLIVAFSPQIQTQFSRAFESGAIQKEYWAICERAGAEKPAKFAGGSSRAAAETPALAAKEAVGGTVEHWIGFSTKTQKAFIAAASGKPDLDSSSSALAGGTVSELVVPDAGSSGQTAESSPVHDKNLSGRASSESAACEPLMPGALPAGKTADKNCSRGKRSTAYRSNKARVKKAVLDWALCGRGERYDFIRIQPRTGRTHQIRVQMAAIGHPIKGDLKYGARRSEPGGGIRLHSCRLRFTHPVTGALLCIEAPPLQPDTLWSLCIQACSGCSSLQLQPSENGTLSRSRQV